MSLLDWRVFTWIGLFLAVGCPIGVAQSSDASGSTIQRGRIDLQGATWTKEATASAGVRVDDAVRLRAGAREGRIRTDPIELPFPVNGVGPHWEASVPEGAALEVAVRTRGDEGGWSPWVPVTHEEPISPTKEGRRTRTPYAGDRAGGLILTEADTRTLQVRVIVRNGERDAPSLRRLSLYLVNTTGRSSPPAESPETRPRTATPDTAEPRIYTRDEWGAQAPTADYRYASATHLAIHHTATATSGAADSWEECAAGIRAIQDYHVNTRGWIDIGYNYLVCQTGAIFQGREDGNDRRDVVAAHDGYNEGSVGTAALGYFHPPENQQPAPGLLDSFVDLFAWIATRREIDPEGVDHYAGYGRTVRTVYGHRDVKATACPGDHLYPERTEIVDRLAALVPTPPSTTVLGTNAPNPATTVTHVDLQLAAGAPVRLTVYDLLGRRIATRRYEFLPAGSHEDALSVRTDRWAPGTYPYRLRVGERTQTGTIRVVR